MPTAVEYPIYINIIIAVGGAIWLLISTLIVYIWRSSLKSNEEHREMVSTRISKLEAVNKEAIQSLIANPILTVPIHSLLCGEVWLRLTERIGLMEDNLKLAIRNGILEAAHNGKK